MVISHCTEHSITVTFSYFTYPVSLIPKLNGYGQGTMHLASFPGLHAQVLSLAVRKVGRRPGWIYHVMCAAADVTYCS